MRNLNYFPLDVESNIYSTTTLKFDDKTCKVLVATLDCKIFCIHYNKFKPLTREVEFTYIPNGAKIISIGALKRGPNDFVIGITHSLAPSSQKSTTRSSTNYSSRDTGDYNRPTTYYLNIYASGSATQPFDLEYVAQGCQTIRLKHVPYHLYSTELVKIVDWTSFSSKSKPFWLLTSGDNSIHAFCEDKPYQSFNEVPLEDSFPELCFLPGLTLWIDVLYLQTANGLERAIALGLENGSVHLYHSSLSKTSKRFELVRESSFDIYTTIVPSVRLFKVNSIRTSDIRSILESKNLFKASNHKIEDQVNLLAVSSTNPSIVFKDVLNSGLKDKLELPESQRLDCSVTSAIGDINLDGFNEILIGTHGKELLTYQYDQRRGEYDLAEVTEFNNPIYAMSIFDLTGDALNDVMILLANGILIMQAAVEDVIEICARRADKLLSLLGI